MDKVKFETAAQLHYKLEKLKHAQRELKGSRDFTMLQRSFPVEHEQIKANALAKAEIFIASKIAEVESEIEKL